MCSRCFDFLFILNGIKVQWETLSYRIACQVIATVEILMQSHDINEDR